MTYLFASRLRDSRLFARKISLSLPIVLCLLSLSAAASRVIAAPTRDTDNMDVITVSATAEVKSVPDMAKLSAGVVTEATTAAQATADNAGVMTKVINALRTAGIQDNDIQTSNLNLEAIYDYANNTQKLRGFRATNMVNVRIHDLTKVGTVTDAVLGAGANRVDSLTFLKEDDSADKTKALQQAARQAASKAQAIADALGFALGNIASVSEGVQSRPVPVPMMQMRGMAADAQMATPVMPGVLTVNATVTVQYHIK